MFRALIYGSHQKPRELVWILGMLIFLTLMAEAFMGYVLPSLDERLRDPKSDNPDQTPAFAKNEARSITPEIAVIVGICTHLGCSPGYVPEMLPQPFDANWKGGFYCPCHQSRFDLAGRVFQGVPAPANLEVPPYHYVDDNHLVVGVPPGAA